MRAAFPPDVQAAFAAHAAPHPAVVREVTLSGWCTGQEEAAGESRTAQLVSLDSITLGPFRVHEA
jgi:hypothetical protein